MVEARIRCCFPFWSGQALNFGSVHIGGISFGKRMPGEEAYTGGVCSFFFLLLL